MAEYIKGNIKLNGVSLLDLPIDIARKKVGIITQDPVVFGGQDDTTLRYNIDPFDEYTDEDCITALHK